MALTTEQVLLLNNLMYIDSGEDSPMYRPDSGQTIGEWLNSIDTSQLDDSSNYGSFMTGADWKNIISSAQNDPTIANMTIATTHVDNTDTGGGGYSAVFVSQDTGEAVVAFRGTAGGEWKDNFTGGNVTDTPQQQNALDWYRQAYDECGLDGYDVTVTGHSKGGNKSKYITLMDDTVDHCVSFDGQGFSDKFMDKYAPEIAARQGKIENHNVDYDYVNLLLNDIGKTTYYKGQDIGYGDGHGGFLENHCPNTFMKYNADGSFTMEVNPNGQAEEMKALDGFLNGYLRSLSDRERNDALELVNSFIDDAFSIKKDATAQEKLDAFMGTLMDSKYSDDLSHLLAYVIKYEQANPEFADQIKSVLKEFGMEGAVQWVEIAENVLNFEYTLEIDLPFGGKLSHTFTFDEIFAIVNGTASKMDDLMHFLKFVGFDVDPDWAIKLISEAIYRWKGIRLSADEIRKLLGIVGDVSDELGDIRVNKDGEDRKVADVSAGGASAGQIKVDLARMRSCADTLDSISRSLDRAADTVQRNAANMRFKILAAEQIREKLQSVESDIRLLETRTKTLSGGLRDAARSYETTENTNVSILST